jgi:hypothetical protein
MLPATSRKIATPFPVERAGRGGWTGVAVYKNESGAALPPPYLVLGFKEKIREGRMIRSAAL